MMRSTVITVMAYGSVVGLGRGHNNRHDGSGDEYGKLHVDLFVLRKSRSSMDKSETKAEEERGEMLAKAPEGAACKECRRSAWIKGK